MVGRILGLGIVCVLLGMAACARVPTDTTRPQPVATWDELTRPVEAEPEQVLAAAADALRRYGLTVAAPIREGLVLSEPALVHGSWAGAPVHARLLCGVPATLRVEPPRFLVTHGDVRPLDTRRAAAVTDAVPVRIRLGVEAWPRLGGSSARLVVQAAAEHIGPPPTHARDAACTPTQALIDELFGFLEAPANGL